MITFWRKLALNLVHSTSFLASPPSQSRQGTRVLSSVTDTLFLSSINYFQIVRWQCCLSQFVWISSALSECFGPTQSSASAAHKRWRWTWTSAVASMGRTARGRIENENMRTGIKYMFKTPMTTLVLKYPRLKVKELTKKIEYNTLPLWLLHPWLWFLFLLSCQIITLLTVHRRPIKILTN